MRPPTRTPPPMLLLLLLPLLVVVAVGPATAQTGKPRLLFGHRGNSQEFPENTIPAFQSCISLGCEANEMDLYLTSDNVVVVIHDSTVDRTTNGTGNIRDFSLAELKTLDAGYRFTTDNGRTYPFRGLGITVPTLAEVLAEVPGGLVNVDMKFHDPMMAQQLARVISQYNAQARMIVGSFSDATADEFRSLMPNVVMLAGIAEITRFTLLFLNDRPQDHIPKSSYYEVPVYVRDLEAYISAANALTPPVKVVFWTINDESQMRKLLDAGADGIITDNARPASQVFAEYDI